MKAMVRVRLGKNDLTESLALSPGGAGAYPSLATPEHMQLINNLPSVRSIRNGLGLPMNPENVYIRRAFIANDRPWADGRRRLDPSAVVEAASLIYDRPVQLNHATDGSDDLPRGRWFRGTSLTDASGTQWTAADYYLVADSENLLLVGRIDGGAVAESSMLIGFPGYVCSICGERARDCSHMPGEEYDGATAYAVVKHLSDIEEASLCWAGMVEGTRMTVAAARDGAMAGPDELDAVLARKSPGARAWDGFWKSRGPRPWDVFWKEVGGAPAP